jgi:hypothetical protein
MKTCRIIKVLAAVLLGGIMLYLTGCANQSTAKLMPGTDINKLKSFYLVQIPDDNKEENTHSLIKANLEKRGFKVSSGLQTQPPYNADAVVSYEDKWMWDITLYMMALDIKIKDPSTEAPLAVGHSLHGSLTRKSPTEMVDEVLTNIFNAKAE